MNRLLLTVFTLFLLANISGQDSNRDDVLKALERQNEILRHRLDVSEKKIDDLLWFQRVGDLAYVDKVYIYGPPLWREKSETAQGAGNPVKFWTYIFIPKKIDKDKKYPLMVLPHGGVHSNFGTYYTHIVRELVSQGYIVVSAEYRGSTGYGESHYKKIDYGGLEVQDVHASKEYMLENYKIVDKNRVGIMGWSHGGLITLMNIFDYPNDYKAAYAGVPVSDIIARMGYKTQEYRDLYSAEYHIGKTAYEDVNEYRRRSPAWNTHKMQNTPLLIYTNTNDGDVNVFEVEHLIKSLKADKKKFEYKIYKNVPGGHSYDRLDTRKAKEIRMTIYKHMAKSLKPPYAFKNIDDLQRAGYRF
ncbi:MAG: prolyl oligopeptidase family serine peptidase [Bacteroidales bacterium]|jgi:dipeptidyl aminopeptidase/acylaminoacyl peptidase|nr:prolyl oligopeptidase family serine peptidase [Bacteroidales bacterium]